MFYYDSGVWRSDALSSSRVGHAFSTRLGGVSALPHTASMNVGFGRGDGDDVVRRNMEILCLAAGLDFKGLIGSPQHHTALVRYVTEDDRGEGITKDNLSPSDGFVTDRPGVSVIVRTADCTPILITGEKPDGSPVVGAAHAGWRGTVNLIAANLVEAVLSLGVLRETLAAAIGPCIGPCHFEVKDDFIGEVASLRGEDFVRRHTARRDGIIFADTRSMNVEILEESGVSRGRIDVSAECTACRPDLYHSHRMTGGVRGTMGNVIGIKGDLG